MNFNLCKQKGKKRKENKKVPKNRVKGLDVTGFARLGREYAAEMCQDSIHTEQCHETARKKTCQLKNFISSLQFLEKL